MTLEKRVCLSVREKAAIVLALLSQGLTHTSDANLTKKSIKGDEQIRNTVGGSEEVDRTRSRSTNITQTDRKSTRQKTEQEFTTNQGNAIMKQMGFGNDFLNYNADTVDSDQTSRDPKFQKQFESLDDIDFKTNTYFGNGGLPPKQREDNPFLSPFEQSNDNSWQKPQKQPKQQENLLDF